MGLWNVQKTSGFFFRLISADFCFLYMKLDKISAKMLCCNKAHFYGLILRLKNLMFCEKSCYQSNNLMNVDFKQCRLFHERVNFCKKKEKFRFFWFLPHARGPPEIFDVHFFESFKKKIQKWLYWVLSNIERNKVMNFGEPSPNPVETADRFRSSGP